MYIPYVLLQKNGGQQGFMRDMTTNTGTGSGTLKRPFCFQNSLT